MPRLSLFVTASLFAAGALQLAAQDGAQSLRLHWEPGKLYKQETFTATTAHSPDDAASSTKGMRVTQETEIRVSTDKDGKDKLVDVKFASVRGEIEANGQTLKFDSTQPAEQQHPVLQQALGKSVGKTFTLVYDESDKFRDVRSLESLSTDTGAVSTLSSMANSREVANLFRKSQEMGLPPVPVSVGDTWTADETIAFPQAGEVRVQMTGKFQSIEERDGRKHAKIVFDGKFGNTADRLDKPVTMVEIGSDSSMSGILYFDLERKVVSFGTYTSDIKLKTPGQTVPFEQKVTSKLVSMEDAK